MNTTPDSLVKTRERDEKEKIKREDATQKSKSRKSQESPHGRRDGGISQSQSPKHPAWPTGVYPFLSFPCVPMKASR
jgi:hypothetical protein